MDTSSDQLISFINSKVPIYRSCAVRILSMKNDVNNKECAYKFLNRLS
jgi:hypothetical protein